MPEEQPRQNFIARSKGNLELCTFDNNNVSSTTTLSREVAKQTRFNASGSRMAVSLVSEIVIFEFDNGSTVNELCKVPIACSDLVLSPSGRYLATFEKINTSDKQQQHYNLIIWKITDTFKVTKLGAFSHKLQSTWTPQWTTDESHFGRMTMNEVQFFKAEVLEKPAFKIQLDNIGAFSIAPGPYPKAAVFIKEAKGLPGAVKVFLLPNTSSPVAQKIFFKADKCSIQWGPNGKHLLAMSQTEVDSTGVSYYGETNLYFVSGDGSFDCRVQLDKEGPIHDFAWSPASDEFIVLYGYMPSKAMLFDLKCEAIYEFPVGSKNHIKWNPQGTLICFGGFGNLPGHVEIWSRYLSSSSAKAVGEIRRIGHFQSQGSSVCEWAPDGITLMTAIVTPRLRVDNGYRIWSWNGKILSSASFGELYAVTWRLPLKCDTKLFPGVIDFSQVKTNYSATGGDSLQAEVTIKKEAYRPPGLRHISYSAQKIGASAPVAVGGSGSSAASQSTLTKEEKLVKRLKEKLDQIITLKEKIRAGEALELNQIEKVKKEEEVRKDYEQAVISLKKK